jgi:hypothetical protein
MKAKTHWESMTQKCRHKPHNTRLRPTPIPQIRLGFESVRDDAGREDGCFHTIVFVVFALSGFVDIGLDGGVQGVYVEVRFWSIVHRKGETDFLGARWSSG